MENSTFSVGELFELFGRELKNDYDPKEISNFIYLLFREWKNWNRAMIRLNTSEILTIEETTRFLQILGELKRNKPIQYIIGKTTFHGMEFLVTPSVLIPRPETEELVDLVIRENSYACNDQLCILDIGTGSGCIAISLKQYFQNSTVTAIDHAVEALEIARQNSEKSECKLEFLNVDILSSPQINPFRVFELIVSNPPYVLESEKVTMHMNVLGFEPHEALFVPDDDPLLFYRAISDFALKYLRIPGKLYLEINERFGEEVCRLLIAMKFTNVCVAKDLQGKDRFVRAELKTPAIR
jgi:release factor glutamine methyltransferase